jgi:uncharacterized protein YdaU (DUF1376 family)
MYYFELNIQKYRSDTSHLDLLEHGVYHQLIGWYYLDEKPIPLDRALVYRRIGARTVEQQQATDRVLLDFFVESPDGWRQKHCDEVIAEYQEGSADAEEGRKHERERKQRTRERRRLLFAVLRDNGHVPAFNTHIAVLEKMAVPYMSHGTSAGTTLARPASGTAITINNKPLTTISPPTPPPVGGGEKSSRPVGKSLPEGFGLDEGSADGLAESVKAVARGLHAALQVDWTIDTLRHHLAQFTAFYRGKTGRDGRSGDWLARWESWCRKAMCDQPQADPVRRDIQARAKARDSPPDAMVRWDLTLQSVQAEAVRLGVRWVDGETHGDLRERVNLARCGLPEGGMAAIVRDSEGVTG